MVVQVIKSFICFSPSVGTSVKFFVKVADFH